MVLSLKRRKSRSSPGFVAGAWNGSNEPIHFVFDGPLPDLRAAALSIWGRISSPGVGAGWSSPVARQAHNLKVAGSNPAPATNPSPLSSGLFLCLRSVVVRALAVVADVQALAFAISVVAQRNELSNDR